MSEENKPQLIPQPTMSLTKQRLVEDMEMIGQELATGAAVQKHMEEHRFVSLFIPLFAGEDISRYPGLSLNTWINFAGSPFTEVGIYNAKGEFLFNVPPMLSPDALAPLDGTSPRGNLPSVTAVMDRANLIARQGLNQMWAFIDHELKKRDSLYNPNRDDAGYTQRWNDILVRYGRPPITGVVTAATTEDQLPNDIDSQAFDEF